MLRLFPRARVRVELVGVEDPTIHYNLACYECQLGNLSAAKEHLVRATKAGVKFRTMALDDTDLEPLWSEIARLDA